MVTRRRLLGATAAAAATTGLARRALAVEPVKRAGPARIKVSCCAYSYRQFLTGANPEMTLLSFLDLAAELGLDGVEITSYYFPRDVNDAYLVALKRRAFLLGLDVSGMSLGNTFCLPPGDARDKQIAGVKRSIEQAAVLGAPVLRIFGGGVPRGATDDDGRKWVAECLDACAELAGQRGVMLALENHGGVTLTPESVIAIVQQVKSDWVGVNLDTGNFHGEDVYADIAQVAPYAVTTHFKTEVTPKGKPKAASDFPRIVDIMTKAGYRGYLSLEYEASENPKTAVPKAIAALRQALAAAG